MIKRIFLSANILYPFHFTLSYSDCCKVVFESIRPSASLVSVLSEIVICCLISSQVVMQVCACEHGKNEVDIPQNALQECNRKTVICFHFDWIS